MITQLIFLTLGLGLVIKGADWFVEGASALAKRYNVSDLAIGLTIVAFGTSAPELVVNVIASVNGYQDIIFGNVIGSNNFNLFIILGIAGVITPLVVQSNTVWKEIPFSFAAVILLFGLANGILSTDAEILTRFDGLVLLILFGLFLYYVYRQLKVDPAQAEIPQKSYSVPKIWGLIVIGLVGLVLGGRWVVDNAVEIATLLGVSEKIIGLTIVAAGTSLPELATSVVAALKKNVDIAVGNIIGSNIFNIFLILAISSLVRPIQYDAVFNIDLYILGGGTLFLFVTMFTGQRKKLDRWEAAVLLVSYIGYTIYLVQKEL